MERSEKGAAESEYWMQRQLDALLAPLGYHCIHDCGWPGSAGSNLDHVLIGPGGVFVVDDKYFSSEIRTGADGRLWCGGHSLEPHIDKALAQAAAVAAVVGVPATAVMVMAIHGAEVKTSPVVRAVH